MQRSITFLMLKLFTFHKDAQPGTLRKRETLIGSPGPFSDDCEKRKFVFYK